MEVIGLSGYARSGKDEAAKVLVEEFGFTQVAFADKLREALYALDPTVKSQKFTDYRHRRLASVIDEYGWDGYKTSDYSDEIRRLIQRLGTEVGRNIINENVWVGATLDHLPSDKIVVTDCRFVNEARGILNYGGTVWRITREGVGPANDHPSETSLDDFTFDMWVRNNGTLEEFKQEVRETYYELSNI